MSPKKVIRITCPSNTYYFAKYYRILFFRDECHVDPLIEVKAIYLTVKSLGITAK